MLTKDCLPLIDLTKKQSAVNILNVQRAILRYGAFRLRAPELKRAFARCVQQNARAFFQLPMCLKGRTTGYVAFGREIIREEPALKESLYFFRKNDQEENHIPPPSDLYRSVKAIHDEWRLLRRPLFDTLSNQILSPHVTLSGTPLLDYESIGLHYYVRQDMTSSEGDYNPPHMDGGTLTILARDDAECDGLEIADLQSTEKLDSKGIGQEASFFPVPAAPGEVVVFLGTRMQRLFGKATARACVHRVRTPTQQEGFGAERFSLAIFCAPPTN